jgi:hypothetical protein
MTHRFLKGLSATAVVALLATAASAQPRPSTLTMSCAQARALVASRGAAVLGTGGQTYDRFVRDRRFCEVTEATQQAFVPTRDTPQCPVGFRCFEPSRDDLFEKF